MKHFSLYVTLVLHWRIVHRICSIVRHSTTYSWATCSLTQLNDDLVGYDKMSGANYYVSMRQVLDSDRRIRAVSLLKFSGISLAEIDSAIKSAEYHSSTDDSLADSLTDALTLIPFRRRMMPT